MAGNSGSGSGGIGGSGPGMWRAIVVIAGLAVVGGVFFGALAHFSDAKDVAAVTGAVTGVIGTIVTAFFGIHATASAGSDATQKVAAAGSDATQKVAAAGSDATRRSRMRVSRAADSMAAVQKDAHDKAITLATYIDPERAEDAELVQQVGLQTTPGWPARRWWRRGAGAITAVTIP